MLSDEQLNSIAERTILEADQNDDQMISLDEFCKALEKADVEQKMSIRFLNWIILKNISSIYSNYKYFIWIVLFIKDDAKIEKYLFF